MNRVFNSPSLTHLDLSSNYIDSISIETFSQLNTLTSLNLASNHLRYLNESLFANLTLLLTALNLYGNKLVSLNGVNVFNGLFSLNTLILAKNRIKSISSNIFTNSLSQLTRLDLQYNELKYLNESTFESLVNLEVLTLNDNSGLGRLPNGVFRGLNKLNILDMYRTNQVELSENVFSFDLVNLRELTLGASGNKNGLFFASNI